MENPGCFAEEFEFKGYRELWRGLYREVNLSYNSKMQSLESDKPGIRIPALPVSRGTALNLSHHPFPHPLLGGYEISFIV